MRQGRPYPPDMERRVLIKIQLAKWDITITELAHQLEIHRTTLSEIINGIRRSKKTEAKIAVFFGKEPDELFPPRTVKDIENMRKNATGNVA